VATMDLVHKLSVRVTGRSLKSRHLFVILPQLAVIDYLEGNTSNTNGEHINAEPKSEVINLL
jgi:hypothetical protein